MDQVGHSITAPIVGLVLVMMGAFAPWALLRLVPLAELGAATVESLRGHGRMVSARADAMGLTAEGWASATTGEMRRAAERALAPPTAGAGEPGSDRTPAEAAAEGAPDEASVPDQEVPPGPAAADAEDVSRYGGGIPNEDGEQTVAQAGPAAAGAAEGGSRLPGLPDMWQADDLTWQPLVLGTDEGWPPRVWPPEGATAGEGGTPVGGPLPDGMEGLPAPEAPFAADPGPLADPLPAPEAPGAADPEPPGGPPPTEPLLPPPHPS